MSISQEFEATGITLKYYNFNDFDRIIHLFTKEYGIVQAIAKGVRNPKRKLLGNTDLLNINRYVLKKGKSLNSILQCESIKYFPFINLDYDKLIYSLFLGELILLFIHEGDDHSKIFNLLVYTLEKIETSEHPIIETLWFQINFLKQIGYEQDFYCCNRCNKKLLYSLNTLKVAEKQEDYNNNSNNLDFLKNNKKLGFSFNTGGIICNDCLIDSSNYKIINQEMLNLLIKIIEFENIEFLNNENELLKKLQDIFKEYLSILSDKKIKSLI
ncbi:MAG: DNA repair protein RecO [Candidatus Sericytochromatia bacterium]